MRAKLQRSLRAKTRQRGQVLLLYALMSTALIGMLGLSLDLGFNYSQRRNLQNDTDAAVSVGLNTLRTAALATPPGSTNGTNGAVSANLTANSFPLPRSTSSTTLCEFVDDTLPINQPTGLCSVVPVPSGTSGVRVTVSETYPTFIMAVVGFATSTISASTTGQIQVASVGGDAPIVVCANATNVDPLGTSWILKTNPITNPGPPVTTSPTEQHPYALDTRTVLNGGPIGATFMIHGPQIKTCGDPGSFKGDLGQAFNNIPNWFGYKPGTNAGPERLRVSNGCTTATGIDGCVLVLPITESSDSSTRIEYTDAFGNSNPWWPAGTAVDGSCTGMSQTAITSPNKPTCVVLWEAFLVTKVAANKHTGTLLDPQVISNLQANGSQNSWHIGDGVTQILVERITS